MKVFLDTSVLLAASGSDRGASREVFRCAAASGWKLLVTQYVLDEVLTNLSKLPAVALSDWIRLREQLIRMDDVLTIDRVVVFEAAKDRPILFGALAWAEVLLTLDRADFGTMLGGEFYGLTILTPGMFLEAERAAGRLRTRN